MKHTYMAIALAMAIGLGACSTHKHDETQHEQHEHQHDHDHEHDHDHQHEHDHDHKEAPKQAESQHEHEAGVIEFREEQAKAAGVATIKVKRAPWRSVLKVSGQLLNAQGEEHSVSATAAGIVQLASGSVTLGAAVRQGEALLYVSASRLQEGDPTLKAKIAYEAAKRAMRRADSLIVNQVISMREYEEVRLTYETARAEYQGQAGFVTARGVRIPAPSSGYLKNLLVSNGDYVSVGQPLATVAQSRRLQLRADVPVRYHARLAEITGANFEASDEGHTFRLEELHGRLLSYSRSISGGSPYLPVFFELDNVGEMPLAGSFVTCYLLGRTEEEQIAIPLTSLIEEQGLYFVYLKTSPGHYRKQEVQLGANDGVRVKVTCGVTEGAEVVTSGAMLIKLASTSSAIPHSHTH